MLLFFDIGGNINDHMEHVTIDPFELDGREYSRLDVIKLISLYISGLMKRLDVNVPGVAMGQMLYFITSAIAYRHFE